MDQSSLNFVEFHKKYDQYPTNKFFLSKKNYQFRAWFANQR